MKHAVEPDRLVLIKVSFEVNLKDIHTAQIKRIFRTVHICTLKGNQDETEIQLFQDEGGAIWYFIGLLCHLAWRCKKALKYYFSDRFTISTTSYFSHECGGRGMPRSHYGPLHGTRDSETWSSIKSQSLSRSCAVTSRAAGWGLRCKYTYSDWLLKVMEKLILSRILSGFSGLGRWM